MAWFKMYHNCPDKIWPDGGCYLEQMNHVVAIFGIIEDEINIQRRLKEKRNG